MEKKNGFQFFGQENDGMSEIINTDIMPGIRFYSKPEEPLQVGVMLRPKGYKIKHHYHKDTQEVLYVAHGHLAVEFDGVLHLAETGDIIYLRAGVHSFEFLEDSKLIEVKQGPFKNDKVYV